MVEEMIKETAVMEQTKSERYIKVLKRARQYVHDGTEFICYALDYVAQDRPELTQECEELAKYIEDGIYPRSVYGGWLRDNVPCRMQVQMPSYEDMRITWIDRMIHTLETKGVLP